MKLLRILTFCGLLFSVGSSVLADGLSSSNVTPSNQDARKATGWTKKGSNVYTTVSSNNVGIGTTVPANKLEITGGSSASDSGIYGITLSTLKTGYTTNKSHLGNNYNGLYLLQNAYYDGTWKSDDATRPSAGIVLSTLNSASGEIAFFTSNTNDAGLGTQQMTLNKDGNLGIGITSPSVTLDVNKAGAKMQLYNSTQGGVGEFYIGSRQTGGTSKYFNIAHKADDATNGSMYFVPNSTTLSNSILTLQSGGNVGIGTTSPSDLLTVQGSLQSAIMLNSGSSYMPEIKFANQGTPLWEIASRPFDSNNLYISAGVNTNDGTALKNAAVVTIQQSGNVGIGTTAPIKALDVVGSIQFSTTLTGTSTTNIGWTKATAANQACNTTCTTACVFGQNTADFSIVDCGDTTADACICAG